MSRMVADCRAFPNEAACTLTISGDEEEVLDAAIEHAVSCHGQTQSRELREQLRGILIAEPPPTARSVDMSRPLRHRRSRP